MKRTICLVTAVVAFCAGTSIASPPQTNRPSKVWTFDAITSLSRMSTDPLYVPLVRVKVDNLTGSQAAAAVCAEISQRSLSSANIGILLQNFGIGNTPCYWIGGSTISLPYHPGDSLSALFPILCSGSSAPCPGGGDPIGDLRVRTPWMDDGVAATSAWMNAFINEYEVAIGAPAPARFHFDNEFALTSACDKCWAELFNLLPYDPSWDIGSVFTPNGVSTIDTLFVAEGINMPASNYDICYGPPINQVWSRWYQRVCNEATEWAMKSAVYDPINTVWPNCKTSDYYTSVKTDGEGSPQRLITDVGAQGKTWNYTHWKGAASMQAPVLYPWAHTAHCNNGCDTGSPTHWAATLDVHAKNLTAGANSFGGGHSGEIVAWIPLVNYPFTGSTPNTYDQNQLRDMLALCYSKGIYELILWYAQPALYPSTTLPITDFNITKHAVDQAYGAEIISAWSTHHVVGSSDELRYELNESNEVEDNDAYVIMADSSGVANIFATFRANFSDQSASTTPNRRSTSLQVVVSTTTASLPRGAQMQVYIKNQWAPGNPWEPLGTPQAVSPRMKVEAASACGAYLNPNTGAIDIKVTYSNLPTSRFVPVDMIQVYELQGKCAADLNGDGAVNIVDLTMFLGAFGTSSCSGDLNFDGSVNTIDLVAFNAAFGTSGECW